jgi:LacI family transcriptional regulator
MKAPATSYSIRDVATQAGVSVGTVSNVLNRPELVAPATRARVEEAIAALGFVRNESARQLRAGRSRGRAGRGQPRPATSSAGPQPSS